MHDPRHWRRLLREQRRSGLSIIEFCRARGVSPSSFHRWRRVVADGDLPSRRRGDAQPAFVELAASSSIAGAAVVIVLGDGRRVEIASGVDEGWVARLIDRLERLREEAAA